MQLRSLIQPITIAIALSGCQGTGSHSTATPQQINNQPPRYTLEFRKDDGSTTTTHMHAFEVKTTDGKTVSAKDGWLTNGDERSPIADGTVVIIDQDGSVLTRDQKSD